MADIDVETSNSVFEILEKWNTELKPENINKNKEVRRTHKPKRRGPTRGPSPC